MIDKDLGIINSSLEVYHKGLEYARSTLPDVVLCDVWLPDIDGFNLTQQLHEDYHTQSIPVILMSARSDPKYSARGKTAGAAHYLRKPFPVEQLLSLIKATIT